MAKRKFRICLKILIWKVAKEKFESRIQWGGRFNFTNESARLYRIALVTSIRPPEEIGLPIFIINKQWDIIKEKPE
jgi:hypothetical protein